MPTRAPMFRPVIALLILASAMMLTLPAIPIAGAMPAAVGVSAVEPMVSAGGYHTCALRTDNRVICWGYNANGQATPPNATFIDVSAGKAHTCAIKTDGTLACWGDNSYSQTSPLPSGTFTQVSAGDRHSCARRNDTAVVCWGDNTSGKTSVPAGAYKQVSAGGVHTCAIKSDDTAACWGDGGDGRTAPPGGTFLQISAGQYNTCGVKSDNAVACWGNNSSGQNSPVAGTYLQVDAGLFHACGLKSDKTLACWGDNTNNRATPPSGTFNHVSAGDLHSCGARTNGSFDCWGNNDWHQADDRIAPSIANQTSGPIVLEGGQALTLTVNASGSPAPSYQWRKGGTPIQGATSSTYSVGAVTTDNAGTYDVVVSNDMGSVVSGPISVTVNKLNQVITFPSIGARNYGDEPVSLTATSTSGLPVVYTVDSGPGVIDGTTLRITGAGTIVVRASQPGNGAFNPAQDKTQQVVVNKANLTVYADNKIMLAHTPVPELTATYDGFVNGDGPNSLNTPISLVTSASPAAPPVGLDPQFCATRFDIDKADLNNITTHKIIISGGTDPNYNVQVAGGFVVILPHCFQISMAMR